MHFYLGILILVCNSFVLSDSIFILTNPWSVSLYKPKIKKTCTRHALRPRLLAKLRHLASLLDLQPLEPQTFEAFATQPTLQLKPVLQPLHILISHSFPSRRRAIAYTQTKDMKDDATGPKTRLTIIIWYHRHSGQETTNPSLVASVPQTQPPVVEKCSVRWAIV